MNLHDLLAHHHLATNPFADEDAQTDPVFQGRCRSSVFHPNWDKIYGDPNSPATSIVFGEKGAGKTAMRMQIAAQIQDHNQTSEQHKNFVIEYDDFNPFLDRFADRLASRKRSSPEKVFAEWKLWDHMDAILSLGVTNLVDQMLGVKNSDDPIANELPADASKRLDRFQKRDLLLLTACYDNSQRETFQSRWRHLRSKVGYYPWQSWLIRGFGIVTTAAAVGVTLYQQKYSWFATVWFWLIIAVGWAPWLAQVWRWWFEAWGVSKQLRVITRETNPLRQVLMQFSARDANGQPLPNKRRTDDRYELFYKFQGVLQALGFSGVTVLVDRVDEPHLASGAPANMKALVWPLLDSKFLKQPGIGLKLLLPSELSEYVLKEDRDFYQRARLDKQNMVPSLEWTGQSLYDLANARVKACAAPGQKASLQDLFVEEIDSRRLVDAFATLRVPRHLFKFLYRTLVAHCQSHVDSDPAWQVPSATFQTQLALYQQEQRTVDAGLSS